MTADAPAADYAGRTPEAKRVTWAELFFDLVFVFAVTQLSASLHADHSLAGLGRALVLFVPVYWVWVSTSVHTNTRDVDNAVDRFGILAAGLGSLLMTLAIPGAYGDRAMLFAVSYLAVRTLLLVLVARTRGWFANPFSVAVFVAAPLRLAGAALGGAWQVALWTAAAVVDIAAPALTRRRVGRVVRFHPAHLSERFGLFLIIALGESVVALGAPAAAHGALDTGVGVAVAVAFVLVGGLWWMYFEFAADAVHHAVETSRVPADTVRQILTYAHFGLIGGIVCVAYGVGEAVHWPGRHLGGTPGVLLFGGCALFVATLAYTGWRISRSLPRIRLAGAVLMPALLPVARLVPALGALCLLVVVVAAVDVWEYAAGRRG